jgi:hypothetical protein
VSQDALGHFLPALTFPLNTNDVPDVPSVDFDLDTPLADALLSGWSARNRGGEGS